MNYILPASALAEDFYQRALDFTTRHQLDGANVSQCLDMVEAAIYDSLSRRMVWCVPSNRLDDLLEKYFPWYAVNQSDDHSRDFYYFVVDHLILSVEELLADIVERKTWIIWYMRRLGDDVVIEKGEDFRIVEFERQVREGTCQVSETIKRAIVA